MTFSMAMTGIWVLATLACLLMIALAHASNKVVKVERDYRNLCLVCTAITWHHGTVQGDVTELKAPLAIPGGKFEFGARIGALEDNVCMRIARQPDVTRRKRGTEPVRIAEDMAVASV